MKLAALLPFMDKEELQSLANDIIEGKKDNIKLAIIFPFLKKDTLEDIVDKLIEKDKSKELYTALPFLNKSTIMKIHQAYKDGKLTHFKEEALLPFLDKDTIKQMFDELVKEKGQE